MAAQSQEQSISLLGFSIWSLAAVFFLYEFFLRTFVGSLAHQIIPDLNLNPATFAIMGSAYYIAYGTMQIPVGILADKFGVRIIMFFATLICVLSTFLFAHADGFNTAFASRLLMGFGSSFAFICLLVIAATWFPKKYFGVCAGFSQFIGTMGPLLAAGPLVAFISSTGNDWRSALGSIAFFGAILAALILLVVRNKPRNGKQTLIFLKQTEPLKLRLLRLLKNRQVWFIALYSASNYVSMALMGAIWGTKYLQVRGLPQHTAANIISLAWLGYAVGCPLVGALSDISRRRKPALISCALLGLTATAGILYFPISNSYWFYSALFFSLGVAAAGQNIGFAAIAETSDVGTRATALGLNNAAITFFAAFISPLASYFIYASAGHGTELKPEHFTIAFSMMPALYLSAFLISFFLIKETYCKPQREAIILRTAQAA